MAGVATIETAIYLVMIFFCFTNRGKTRFKFPQISFVILGKKTTGFDVNFMIAVAGLGIVVYIILLFHNMDFNLRNKNTFRKPPFFMGNRNWPLNRYFFQGYLFI